MAFPDSLRAFWRGLFLAFPFIPESAFVPLFAAALLVCG